MTLGFTVVDLLRAGRTGGALHMGLRRLSEDEWLWPSVDRAARAAAFAAHPDAVLISPGAEAAGREVAAMLGIEGGLAEAAGVIWEDLCILQADDEAGPYRLTGGALGFATDWHLSEKIGLPMTAIHAPIHGYAEQLAAGVDHVFRTLAPGPIFGRANWFIVADGAWRYMPQDDPAERFAHVTPDNAGETLFVRCERQTLRRLPQTGAMLFTIGIAVAPLGTLEPALVSRLSDGLAALPDPEQRRRHAPYYAPALHGYAASVAGERIEARA